MRPVVWLVLGAAAVAGSAVLGAQTVADLVRPTELTEVAACTGAASEDCLARGPATVERETRSRFRWLTGERRWSLNVSAIAPQVRGNDTTRVTVPEQHGQDQIRDGMQLTAVYYGGNPVLLELSSDTVLETEQHPRRSTFTSGYLAIGLLGMSVFAVQVGWHNGRRRSWWRRVDYEAPNGGLISAVLFFAGMAGMVTQSAVGASRWPAVVVSLAVAGVLGGLLLLKKRRKSPAEPGISS